MSRGFARLHLLALAALLLLLAASALFPMLAPHRPKRTPIASGFAGQAYRLALERQARNELAGDYYYGDGLGANLTLHLSTPANSAFAGMAA